MSYTTSGVQRQSGVHLARLSVMVVVAVLGLSGVGVAQTPARTMPVFEVDTTWPALPNNWVLGVTAAVSVDQHDNVWILHRPRSVPEELLERAAPPVLAFDPDGRFLQAWGGDGDGAGYDWPDNEHGIFIDNEDNVWITGNGESMAGGTRRGDDMLLKFTADGTIVMQIGERSQSTGNADTVNMRRPADLFVYPETNEVFVADGYGNRRVVVYDATTGAYKRMWGAFGNTPEDEAPAPGGGRGGRGGAPPDNGEGPGSQQFGNRVHAVEISNDGMLYLADRANRRVQVFTTDGEYLTQVFINRGLSPAGSAAGLAFSPDPEQQFLYVADYNNSHMLVLDRKSLEVLYQFGMRSDRPGDFRGPHEISADSKGNLYVAEVSPGNRAQKFVMTGMSPTLPANALTAAQLAQPTE